MVFLYPVYLLYYEHLCAQGFFACFFLPFFNSFSTEESSGWDCLGECHKHPKGPCSSLSVVPLLKTPDKINSTNKSLFHTLKVLPGLETEPQVFIPSHLERLAPLSVFRELTHLFVFWVRTGHFTHSSLHDCKFLIYFIWQENRLNHPSSHHTKRRRETLQTILKSGQDVPVRADKGYSFVEELCDGVLESWVSLQGCSDGAVNPRQTSRNT